MSRETLRALVVVLGAVVLTAAGPGAAGTAEARPAPTWSWPVPGVVTRPFDPPAQRWGAGHRGVDLLTAPGVPVRAAGPGRVSYAGLLAGRGVLVVVHGALRTTYEPVTAAVGLGAAVEGGQVIGTVEPGHAGCPVLACLHWGLRRGDDYLDPLRLVEPRAVRLLPVDGAAGRSRPGPAAEAVAPGRASVGEAPASQHRAAATASEAPRGRPPTGPTTLAALGAGAVLAGAALRRRS